MKTHRCHYCTPLTLPFFFSFFLFFVTFSSRKDSAGDGDREIEESRGGRESAENKATAVDIWSSYTWSRNFRLIIFIWFLDGVRHTVGVKREKEREEERGGGSGFGEAVVGRR